MDLVRALGARYDEFNEVHRGIVRNAISRYGGHVFRTEGDAFFAVFTSIGDGAAAAAEMQSGVASYPWPDDADLGLRVGLHAGRAYSAGDDYGGIEVSRAARIASIGWGEQILLSDPARSRNDADLRRTSPRRWR